MVSGLGSGYGAAYVPVLASNDYTLEEGESSVFSWELLLLLTTYYLLLTIDYWLWTIDY